MSTASQPLAAAAALCPREVWPRDARNQVVQQPQWLWDGYLARGETTLLTSQWKTGKTTLVSVLLTKLAGGGQIGEQAVAPATKAAVVSEEPLDNWLRRDDELNFNESVCFFCRPFRNKPSVEQWHALIARLCLLRQRREIDLVVIDPLAHFLPSGGESQADRMMHLLRPLEEVTGEGAAVLLLHHPKKGDVFSGQAARGTGALCAYADVLIEMRSANMKDRADRRRLLEAFSRHKQTPRTTVLELSPDGRDYHVSAMPADGEFQHAWSCLECLLDGRKLTRLQIQRAWPERPCPSDVSNWRWLKRGIELGLLAEEGSGARGDPRRYWRKGQTATWTPDPVEMLNLGTP